MRAVYFLSIGGDAGAFSSDGWGGVFVSRGTDSLPAFGQGNPAPTSTFDILPLKKENIIFDHSQMTRNCRRGGRMDAADSRCPIDGQPAVVLATGGDHEV